MGSWYLPGKNSIFWAMVESLVDSRIFSKDLTVLPYTPNMPQTYTDFIAQPAGTSVDAYINGTYTLSTTVVDATGLIQFQANLPYTSGKLFQLDLKLTATGVLLKTMFFSTWNLYFFYEVFGQLFQEKEALIQQIRNNLVLSTAQDTVLTQNFGIFFNVDKRVDQTFDDYRSMLESFYIAYLNAATNYGVTKAIHDITGVDPIILPFRNIIGYRVFDYYKYTRLVPAGAGTAIVVRDEDPTRAHMFAEDQLTGGQSVNFGDLGIVFLPPITPFSTAEKGNGLFLVVNYSDIMRTVTEQIVKGANDSLDLLNSQNLTASTVIISSYAETTNFTVDRVNGKIQWLAGAQPATGVTYSVTYNFLLIKPIQQALRQLKPAFRKFVIQVLTSTGVMYFTL